MTLLFLLVALWPLFYAGGIGMIALLEPRSTDEWLFGFAGIYILLSITLAVVYALCDRGTKRSSCSITAKTISTLFTAVIIAWIVSSWISAHAATQNGAMEAFLGVFLQIILLLPWLIADFALRLAMAIQCGRLIAPINSIRRLHIFLHLIPIADLISSIAVHKQLKRNT